jgi:hypothetical protein
MIVSLTRIFDELIECPMNLFGLYIPNLLTIFVCLATMRI